MTDYTKRPNLKLNNIIKKVSNWESGEFKRPNHPDFMTSSELSVIEFSGIRQNEITRTWEFWVGGKIAASLSEEAATPQALRKMHTDLFLLKDDTQADINHGPANQ
jgi:hypothetical protein